MTATSTPPASLTQVPAQEDPFGARQTGERTSAARTSGPATPTPAPAAPPLAVGRSLGGGQERALVGVVLGFALAVAAVVVLGGYRGTRRRY